MPTSTSAATVPMNEVIMHGSITSAGFVACCRRAITDNRSREERQPGCVQTHEHDLRIARAVLLIVQFLEALHCL